jgi:hypothetical protein
MIDSFATKAMSRIATVLAGLALLSGPALAQSDPSVKHAPQAGNALCLF